MNIVDKYRVLGVRTNADTPEDAQNAINFGAEGIGLFRIEHMFYGKNSEQPLAKLRKMILSKSLDERINALNELEPYIKNAVKGTMKVMNGKPVTFRLLDPPLHEFVPQTTEKMADLIFKTRPELKDTIYIAYCPERVLPGNVIYELEHNDRVIGGINQESSQKATEFYKHFVKGNLHITNARTAEMCKLTENSSRDAQIAFANELSIICDKAGINVWELIELANKHPRVNILQPGSGVGGHCIAVDPWFIVSDFPEQTQIIKRARETNDYKADWCANKVIEACNQFESKYNREPVVACMGLAFKPDIDDLRESPAKYITSRIISEARAQVLVVEPNIKTHKTFNLIDYKEAYKKADIVAWLVRHKEFINYPQTPEKQEFDFCGVYK